MSVLPYRGDIEIAIVYYRAGYTPEDYPTQKASQ